MKVLDDIVPLLMLFRKAVEDSIVEYLMLHAEPSLSEFLDSVIASVTDNIAVMENKMQVIQIAKVIPVRHDQLYRVIDDEINCRVNAYNDFKSRRSEVKETCFYNKFGPAFNKLTNETQSFIKDFMKFLRDGIKIAVAEFKDQIVKWTTDIPDALSCGVTGCVADYIAINKENILKTINIGHDVKSIREHYISLYPVKQKAVESMISDEFNGIYETINECYN
ncbi:unnamed protein product [Diamesa tonsa]